MSHKRDTQEEETKTMIMRQAFLKGWNAKQIAGYFGCKIWTVYDRVPVKMYTKRMKKQ